MQATLHFLFFLLAVPLAGAFSPAAKSATHPISPLSSALKANFLSNILRGNTDKDPNLPTVIFEIPTNDVKIGALKFLIQVHMVSQGNKPEKGTWFPKQNEEGGLDLYFKDGTGMCTVAMTEYCVKAERYGSKPSLQYLLQESILLHSVLDELEKTAFEVDDIEQEKRLLTLRDPDGIEEARKSLPAKSEDLRMN